MIRCQKIKTYYEQNATSFVKAENGKWTTLDQVLTGPILLDEMWPSDDKKKIIILRFCVILAAELIELNSSLVVGQK